MEFDLVVADVVHVEDLLLLVVLDPDEGGSQGYWSESAVKEE
jgi:hypothetical protein